MQLVFIADPPPANETDPPDSFSDLAAVLSCVASSLVQIKVQVDASYPRCIAAALQIDSRVMYAAKTFIIAHTLISKLVSRAQSGFMIEIYSTTAGEGRRSAQRNRRGGASNYSLTLVTDDSIVRASSGAEQDDS
eukprot:6179220-Pleurochrysis_carterae.AAC.3